MLTTRFLQSADENKYVKEKKVGASVTDDLSRFPFNLIYYIIS